ncbi:redoxin domain-containing protein [Pseudoalteromonas sp. S2893]|uniref:redoxin domain-containing protein n=1 Tax=Pseudoalteromonas sp. S2893 TaxID=579530 RepID=UPI002016A683|nr:redoxin domain-containing protein [Pseudoalteromonas sp. S2893]
MRYLNLLEAQLPALKELGVSVCAVSADNRAQLTQCMDTLSVSFPIAYGLTQQQMKQLGLYISSPRSEQETDHNFAEPAIFVVNEQGILQAVNISNAPYLRPDLDVVVRGLKFIKEQNNYPIRGTVV